MSNRMCHCFSNKRYLLVALFTFLIAVLAIPLWAGYASAAETNLARGKSYRSSANETATFTAEKAFDGSTDRNSRWSSPQGDSAWLAVDLGQPTSIRRMHLILERATPTSMVIQYATGDAWPSSDDEWTDITETDRRAYLGSPDTNFYLENAIEARYVRINFRKLANTTPYDSINWKNVAVYEFELYSDFSDAERVAPAQADGDNVALGKPTSASSREVAKFDAPMATDGDKSSTRWGSSVGDRPAWLTVDLGDIYDVGFITLQWETRKATNYKIETATSLDAWTDTKVFTSRPDAKQQVIDVRQGETPIKARYLRLNIANYDAKDPDSNITWDTISLYELSASRTMPRMSVDELASLISVTDSGEGSTLDVSIPSVAGFEVEFAGADYQQLVDRVGDRYVINRPLISKDVNLVFSIKDTATDTTKKIGKTVTLTGRMGANNEGRNPAPKTLPELQEWFGNNSGELSFSDLSIYYSDARLKDIADDFSSDVKELGINVSAEPALKASAADGQYVMFTTLVSSEENNLLGEEGYVIDVQENGITISVANLDVVPGATAAASFGAQSILQATKLSDNHIPLGSGRDYPLMEVRGVSIDVGRMPISLSWLNQTLKELAYYKLNDVNLHLSDNYIWIEDYPQGKKRDAYAAFRMENDTIKKGTTLTLGGESYTVSKDLTAKDVFYTKDEMRELVSRWAKRGVDISPEFDAPAHALALTNAIPELAVGENGHRNAEHLNLTTKLNGSIDYLKTVWGEYLAGDNPVFSGPTINIGADEYSVASESGVSVPSRDEISQGYWNFANALISYGEGLGKTVRMWGSVSQYRTGSLPEDTSRVELLMWNNGYANPQEAYNKGFKLINILENPNYIVPTASYYYDYLNQQSLYNFDYGYKNSLRLLPGDPQAIGGMYAVWNDKVDKSASKYTEYDVYLRMHAANPYIAANLWGKKTLEFASAKERADALGETPGTDFGYNKGEKSYQNSFDTDPATENVSYNAEGRSYITTGAETHLALSETDNTMGLKNSLRIQLRRQDPSNKEQILLSSAWGEILAVNSNGKVAIRRAGHEIEFNYSLPISRWVELEFRNDVDMTSLFVDGQLVQTIGSHEKAGARNPGRAPHATMMLPLSYIGSAHGNSFIGSIDNIRVEAWPEGTDLATTGYVQTLPLLEELDRAAASEKTDELEAAIREAKAVSAKMNPTQAEVDEAIAQLRENASEVSEFADYTELRRILSIIPKDADALDIFSSEVASQLANVKRSILFDLPKTQQAEVDGWTNLLKNLLLEGDKRQLGSTWVNRTDLVAYAPSFQPGSGEAANAIDGNVDTVYHSQWSNATIPADEGAFYLDISRRDGRAMTVSTYEYTPRTSQQNGIVTSYEIKVQQPNGTWKSVATGSWASNNSVKTVSFDPIRATKVRLVGRQGYNNFMSAAEVRINDEEAAVDVSSDRLYVSHLKSLDGTKFATGVYDSAGKTFNTWTTPSNKTNAETKRSELIEAIRVLVRNEAVETEPGEEIPDGPSQMASPVENVYPNSLAENAPRKVSLNNRWKFSLSDPSGAEGVSYTDSAWKTVNLPHDYSIEQPFQLGATEGESGWLPGGTAWYRKTFTIGDAYTSKRILVNFDGIYMNSTVYINGHFLGMHHYGYTPFSYDITPYLKFNGENVLAVRVDHKVPSSRWYSGSGISRPVSLIVTDKVSVAKDGLMITTPDLDKHPATGNTHAAITVSNANTESVSNVTLSATITKRGHIDVLATAETSIEQIDAHSNALAELDLTVDNPELWSIDNPVLYTMTVAVTKDGELIDSYSSDFGYRYIDWIASTGFKLNGQNIKLKGVSMHHDMGPLGAAQEPAAIARQLSILKRMGVNAIRTTHATPTRAYIEEADRQGILIFEEFFDGNALPKNGNVNDYSKWWNTKVSADGAEIMLPSGISADPSWPEYDLRATVARDYNSPSVVAWSLGNEMTEGTSGDKTPVRRAVIDLIAWIKDADPTRFFTSGDNGVNNTNNASDLMRAASQANDMGAFGVNYNMGTYNRWPNENIRWYGSETSSPSTSRNVYTTFGVTENPFVATGYDYRSVSWGATAANTWYNTILRDSCAGTFIWTGFDYLGEPTPWNQIGSSSSTGGPYPRSSYFGVIDTAGMPKDDFYLYQSLWNNNVHTLHMLPVWNEDAITANGKGKVPIVVYTDADAAELFFTDAETGTTTSLGKKEFSTKTTAAGYSYHIYEGADKESEQPRNLYFTWYVNKTPFKPGTFSVKVYNAGSTTPLDTTDWDGRQSITTAGTAKKITATPETNTLTADGHDLVYIRLDVQDEAGIIAPMADNLISVDVENGELVALDNGDASDQTMFSNTSRKAFRGSLMALVRTNNPGEVRVHASSAGLESADIVLQASTAGDGDNTSAVAFFEMSKNYYVKRGVAPELPQTIKVHMTDGSVKDAAVSWKPYDEALLNETGTFTIAGTAEGQPVSVYVTVLDNVAAVLNYSATTPVGVAPELPESRPAVLPNGVVTNANFDVQWSEVDPASYAQAGTYIVEGTSNIFGKQYRITASIRVAEEQFSYGDNVAPDAFRKRQDIEPSEQSDTFEALFDGTTQPPINSSGGKDPNRWSNYTFRNNHRDQLVNNIEIEYATQARLGRLVLYSMSDNYSARFMPEGQNKIYYKNNPEDEWIEVSAAESVTSVAGNLKKYTYDFAPISATLIKVEVHSSAETNTRAGFACTILTEMELYTIRGSYNVGNTNDLAEWYVGGRTVPGTDLQKRTTFTSAAEAAVDAVGKDNAAVTILPSYQNQVFVVTEAEDHLSRGLYTVYLSQETSGSRDIAVEDIQSVVANSELNPPSNAEGTIAYATDGKTATHWHTNWRNNNTAETPEKRTVTWTLKKPEAVDALRYLPRTTGGYNGYITRYRIESSNDGTNWTSVTEGMWPMDAKPMDEWREAAFSEPVVAKYFRLIPLETYADSGNNKHASAAELRLQRAKTSLEDPDVHVMVSASRALDVLDAIHPYQDSRDVDVVHNNNVLRNGIDYTLSWDNNTQPGRATVIITGIGDYRGRVTKEIELSLTDVQMDSDKLTYEVSDEAIVDEVSAESPVESLDTLVVRMGDTVLQEGRDYTLVWENNTQAGTARVTIAGKEGSRFKGSKSFEFEIKLGKRQLDEAEVSLVEDTMYVVGDIPEEGITPAVSVSYRGIALSQGEDYTVRYENNSEPGTAKVVIEGKGRYEGTLEKEFVLKQATFKLLDTDLTTPLESVEAGREVVVSVSDYKPNTELSVYLHSEPVFLGTMTTADDGSASRSFVVPTTTEPGAHEVWIHEGSDKAELARLAITVAKPETPSENVGEGTGITIDTPTTPTAPTNSGQAGAGTATTTTTTKQVKKASIPQTSDVRYPYVLAGFAALFIFGVGVRMHKRS